MLQGSPIYYCVLQVSFVTLYLKRYYVHMLRCSRLCYKISRQLRAMSRKYICIFQQLLQYDGPKKLQYLLGYK